MRILAIETSCDETAAAVVEDGRKVLANVVNTQIDLHRLYGGVVPEIASRQHIEQIDRVVAEALAVAHAAEKVCGGTERTGAGLPGGESDVRERDEAATYSGRGGDKGNSDCGDTVCAGEGRPAVRCAAAGTMGSKNIEINRLGECGMPDSGGASERTGAERAAARAGSEMPEDSGAGHTERMGRGVPEAASTAETAHCRMVGDRAAECRHPSQKVDLTGIDAIAVTAWPGLIGALLTGVNFAKGLSFAAGLPLIPVHHIRGHIAACYLSHPELEPPFLCLIVSGGHSNIAVVEDYCNIHILSRTRDDAAGECFDKVARVMGLPYPGGVALDQLSAGVAAPGRYRFPNPTVEGSPMDFSFSGLKTAAINLIHNAAQKGEELDKRAFAADFSEAVVHILLSRLTLAVEETGLKKLAVAGGVSANSRLRAGVRELARRRDCALYLPELRYCGDNAAMIGAAGYYEFLAGHTADSSLNAKATKSIE